MLTKLTDEQNKLKKEVKEYWINKLTESTEIDEKKLKEGIKFCYIKLKNKNPRIFIVNNPVEAVKLARKLGNNTVKTLHYFGLGYDAGWLAFYDYFLRLGIVKSESFVKYKDFIECGAFGYIFLENSVIAVRRPLFVKRNSKGQMHCTTGPAIEFMGEGFKSWRLNGVCVTEKIVLHPEQLTKEEILGEKNVDIRREMIRQIGMDRFCSLVNPKVLDKQGDYELLSINLSDTLKDCRYLKMKNPSIGMFHVEGVEGYCDTVEKALTWRASSILQKGGKWKPSRLS